MEQAKILVRIKNPQGHRHAGVHYPEGAKLEVDTHTFEQMRRLGAAEAVEIAVPGSANIDMEAARARLATEQEQGGRSFPSAGRFGGKRRR